MTSTPKILASPGSSWPLCCLWPSMELPQAWTMLETRSEKTSAVWDAGWTRWLLIIAIFNICYIHCTHQAAHFGGLSSNLSIVKYTKTAPAAAAPPPPPQPPVILKSAPVIQSVIRNSTDTSTNSNSINNKSNRMMIYDDLWWSVVFATTPPLKQSLSQMRRSQRLCKGVDWDGQHEAVQAKGQKKAKSRQLPSKP